MNRIKIYLEGGGDGKEGKAAIRQGMLGFLDSMKQLAREKSIHFDVVTCGARQQAFRAFKHELETKARTSVTLLLVDAESAVGLPPRRHLSSVDGWALDTVDEDSIHLMIQVMETWIVADPQALRDYYKQGFVDCLPPSQDLETVDKSRIEALLKRATTQTQKGEYQKIRHAADLLGRIDEAVVRRRCPSCNRLFTSLQSKIQRA
ncbi:MAG: DUF4276 family protein [Acidobacteriota bacterium]|nr:DUF4276 family protein [Acidobacteriota bacterium]